MARAPRSPIRAVGGSYLGGARCGGRVIHGPVWDLGQAIHCALPMLTRVTARAWTPITVRGRCGVDYRKDGGIRVTSWEGKDCSADALMALATWLRRTSCGTGRMQRLEDATELMALRGALYPQTRRGCGFLRRTHTLHRLPPV
jgi:hypothetical protein